MHLLELMATIGIHMQMKNGYGLAYISNKMKHVFLHIVTQSMLQAMESTWYNLLGIWQEFDIGKDKETGPR